MAANAFSQALRAGALDELYAKADTVREKMLKKGLVAEHSYHFKKYPKCFTGKEFVDFVVKAESIPRSEAMIVGYLFVMFGVMHHVCDDHVFKDGGLFFRFRRDDDTYKADDLAYRALLRKALHIYVASHASGTMIKDRFWGKRSFVECFVNREFFPWLMVQELVKDHSGAVKLAQELQHIGFLRHVCDDHVIDDTNYFFFRFTLDDLSTSKEYDSLFKTHEGGLYTGVIDNTLRLLVPKVRAALRRQSSRASDIHSSYTVMRKTSSAVDGDVMEALQEDVSAMEFDGDSFVVKGGRNAASESTVSKAEGQAMLDDMRASLEAKEWYKGYQTQPEIDSVLQNGNMSDGSWLVYELKDEAKPRGTLMLCVAFKGATWHMPLQCSIYIQGAKAKPMFMYSIGNSKHFENIEDLISHFSDDANSSQMPCTLRA